MKKSSRCSACCFLVYLNGCAAKNPLQAVIGKTFIFEDGGFGGPFAITINEDGTFQYSEGTLSSYIGIGTWEINETAITLTDNIAYSGNIRKNIFNITNDSLIWTETDSSNFMYTNLTDGAVFQMQ